MEIDKIFIDSLPATSIITIKKFKSLGINSYFDLLNYFPFRYENYNLVTPITSLQIGETVTVKGKIASAKNQYTHSHITIQKIIVKDITGQITVDWFNQPYLIRLFSLGKIISVAGLVKQFGSHLILEPKEYDVGENQMHTGRIVPIYSEKKGLSSRTIREKIYLTLHPQIPNDFQISETLPKEIISFNGLIDEETAYRQIHFPDNHDLENQSRYRLAFDELFCLQLSNQLIKKDWQIEKVINKFNIHQKNEILFKKFLANLPFTLTKDQVKVIDEIIIDLKKHTPMNRFLQGDVGSGKTVVAAAACYLSYLNKYQSIIMAPTEILANQHFSTLTGLFKNLNLKIGLQTGSVKTKAHKKYDIMIGTHALLNHKLNFDQVGLVVIDEQHRFGVRQRAMLKEKSLRPHLLTMTATPIPRTVALTLYGELDLSYIQEMPKGRLPVKTYLVPDAKREAGYQWIKNQINNHHSQVFIVCPLIEESQSETLKSIKAAKIEFEKLKNIFPGFRLGLLHGKIKSQEKNLVMTDFKNKKIDILVSTPVIEVGIDIPGATIMVIEGADRFGLAQLHQLRGRIGRSNIQSYCFLYTENDKESTVSRLNFFCKNNLGALLAKYDLDHRGAGNIFGSEQHGFVNLKIASLSDYDLIEKTKAAVDYFIKHKNLNEYQTLKKRIKTNLDRQVSRD